MARTLTVGAVVVLVTQMLSGCGASSPDDSTLASVESTMPDVGLTFAEWCGSWGLQCPTTPPANVPDPDHPWTATEWRGVLATLRAVGQGATTYKITASELNDPRLTAVATALGVDSLLVELRARMRNAGFVSLDVAGGAMTMNAAAPSDFTTASGLAVHSDARTRIGVTPAMDLAVEGISAAGPLGAGDSLEHVAFTGTNVVSFGGPATEVSNAPIKFLFDELAALDLSHLPAMPGYLQLQPAVMSIKDWATEGVRELDLGADALRSAAANVPVLIRDPAMQQPVGKILELLTSVRSTAASRRDKLLQSEVSRGFKCTVGTQAELTFATRFGIQSVTRNGAAAATVVLYGIKAKPLTGPVRPTFSIGRLDLEPTRIVIYDVPVVGTYVVDMSDPSSTAGPLTCN